MINPILFDMAETIRCRFEMGVCLSMYPNPAKIGNKVYATIRTKIFYNTQRVCLARNYNYVVGNCTVAQVGKDEYKCEIPVPVDEVKPGYYYAFIDSLKDCLPTENNRAVPYPQEAKSKDVELKVVPYHI
jgi:hypothetical protein